MSETRSAPGTVMESRWRPSIIWFVLLVALVIAANANAIADLAVLWWTNDSYGHGLLVVPISLYLIWRSRDVLQYQVPTATYWGVPAPILAERPMVHRFFHRHCRLGTVRARPLGGCSGVDGIGVARFKNLGFSLGLPRVCYPGVGGICPRLAGQHGRHGASNCSTNRRTHFFGGSHAADRQRCV